MKESAMMGKIIIIFVGITLFGLVQPLFATTPAEIEKMWKERGSIALTRLASYQKEVDFSKSFKSQLEFGLEFAFAMHAVDDTEVYNPSHKIENGLDFYKIVLNKGKYTKPTRGIGGEGLFVINYIYDHKTGDFIGSKVESLPSGWFILTSPELPKALLLDVNEGGLMILFDSSNPFISSVIELSK